MERFTFLVIVLGIATSVTARTIVPAGEVSGHWELATGTPFDTILFTVADTPGFSDPDTTLGGWKGITFQSFPIRTSSCAAISLKGMWLMPAGGTFNGSTAGVLFNSVFCGNHAATRYPGASSGGFGVSNGSSAVIMNCTFSRGYSGPFDLLEQRTRPDRGGCGA